MMSQLMELWDIKYENFRMFSIVFDIFFPKPFTIMSECAIILS